MAACAGLANLGGVIGAAAAAVGRTTDFLVSGILAGEPAALAVAAIVAVFILGVYQVTRIGASFLALTGFFILVLCPP
ncbi:MAG: hypothetical protein ABEI97_02530 [Candidatus Nanohaloarchaea archaeon]